MDHGDGDATILRTEDRCPNAAGQVRLYITNRQLKICVFYKLRWKLPTELKISHTIADADGMGD